MLFPILLIIVTSLPLNTLTSTLPSPSLCKSEADYNQIHQTLNTYPLAIDTKDFSLLATVFTNDAVADYDTGVGILTGLIEIQSGLAISLAPVNTQHALTTQLISFVNDTVANTITYYTASHFGQGEAEGQVLYAYGKYLDTLIKISNASSSEEDTIWRISTRELVYMGPLIGNISVFES